MPRFFFDTDDGDRVYRDERGAVLPSIEEAIHETRKLAFDLFYGAPSVGRTILACVVRGEDGRLLYKLMMDCTGEVGTTGGTVHSEPGHLMR